MDPKLNDFIEKVLLDHGITPCDVSETALRTLAPVFQALLELRVAAADVVMSQAGPQLSQRIRALERTLVP